EHLKGRHIPNCRRGCGRGCAPPSACVYLSTVLLFLRGPKNMRIPRPLAKAAVAALVVTSAFGLVGSSAVTAAPVVPSAGPALSWLRGALNDTRATRHLFVL